MFLFEQHTSAWFLLLVFLLPLLWWRWTRSRSSSAVIGCSSTSILSHVSPRSWVVRTRWIIPTLRTIAVVALIVCIARPLRKPTTRRSVHADAVAIEMVVDRSGSMQAQDFIVQNGLERHTARGGTAGRGCRFHSRRRGPWKAGSNDLIGLVSVCVVSRQQLPNDL